MTKRSSNSAPTARSKRKSPEELFASLSPAARRKYLDLQLAEDFSAFVMKVFETVSPGDEFQSNWHIEAMIYAAEGVIVGKTRRLITTVPPRHLKSIIFSVALPAFLLGQDPATRIICVSYSNDLAVKHANDFRAVMGSQWYRRIFPGTRVSREKDTQYETMTTARGYRYATSLHGTLTGRGANVIVLDDPQKPDEALSEAQRNSAGQWFDTTLLSRLDSKSEGAVVMVMQRLHEDDLVGRMLEKGGWEHLKIAAIAEEDEEIPIGFNRVYKRKVGSVIDPRRESAQDLARLRRSMGELFFSAQYQQEPIPLAGNIIKAQWFKEYDVLPSHTYKDTLVISIDTAMKAEQLADFSVATIWLAQGENSYLLDVWRQRVDFPDLKHAVFRLREKYPGATILIEDKGSGTSLIQELRASKLAVIGINPEGDKATRAAKISAQFEAGALFFPKTAPWLSALKAELLGFPNTRHNDQVDSVTQALSWIGLHRLNRIPYVLPIIVTKPRTYFGDHPGWVP